MAARVRLRRAVLLLGLFALTLVRRRESWAGVLLAAPAMVCTSQGLSLKPATVAIALAVLASHAIYGSRRQGVVSIVLVVSALATIPLLSPVLDPGTTAQLALFVTPVPVLIMFSLLLQAFRTALVRQQQAADRDSLVVRTSRSLLAVTDPARARAVIWGAVCELPAIAPKGRPGLILVQCRTTQTVVTATAGPATVPVGSVMPRRAFTDALVSFDPVPVEPGQLELPTDVKGHTEARADRLVGLRWGSDDDLVLCSSAAAGPQG
jgi:hypothetical protein